MQKIRIVTLNIWQEQGLWEQRLELIQEHFQSLMADVFCLQEVRQVPERIPNQAATLAQSLNLHFTYETAQPWGGGDEGLAILSRYPIVERHFVALPSSERDGRRICLGAVLDLGATQMWIFTTHLAYRLTDGVLREQQVYEVDRFVQSHATAAVASVLAGDFNARPEADEIRFLRGLTSIQGKRTYYQDAFAVCNPGALGYTWARENPYTLELEWLEPDRRLDYIFVTPMTRAGIGRIHSCRMVCTSPNASGIWCSDHYGLMAEIIVS